MNQFVTVHLYDSLPQSLLEKFRIEKSAGKVEHYYDEAFHARIDQYLDAGIGKCSLAKESVASMVTTALKHYDGLRYDLLSWVIMPNHVPFLIRQKPDISLSMIMKDLKGFTARHANKILGTRGPFWHPDYFDRYVRDSEHFDRIVWYIEQNPVSAGLCARAEDWVYGSANRKHKTADTDVRVPL